MEQSWGWWLGFGVFVLAMLGVDLGVFHRRSHEVKLKEATLWTLLWIVVALLFNLGLWQGWVGAYDPGLRPRVALEFLTAYLLEKSLSVDNLFVFALIFTYFAVAPRHQHRVLFYGILGALVFRAVFIFGGLWLVERFAWMIYVFGIFLILTGLKLAFSKERQIQPERNPVLRLMRRILPVTDHYSEGRFVVRQAGRVLATPLLLVLVLLETTDVMFALDSIPAVIGVTRDPFIVFTSNVFAILGLRAAYFVLAAFLRMFRFLSIGLAVLLVFIGGKMLVEPWLHIPVGSSFIVVGSVLVIAVIASLIWPQKPVPAVEGSVG